MYLIFSFLFFRGSPPKGELLEMGIPGYYNPTDPLSPIHESELEANHWQSESNDTQKSHMTLSATNNNENLKVQDLEDAESEISKKPD